MTFNPFTLSISIYIFTVGVLDPFSMSLNKKDRSINIEEPTVGAILQPGSNLNSIESINPNKQNLDDDQNVFPIGYGK